MHQGPQESRKNYDNNNIAMVHDTEALIIKSLSGKLHNQQYSIIQRGNELLIVVLYECNLIIFWYVQSHCLGGDGSIIFMSLRLFHGHKIVKVP